MRPEPLLATALLTLSACTAGHGTVDRARLGDAPVLSGGTYSTGGGVTIAADIREKNGATQICGVWAQSRQQSVLSKGTARDVVDKGAVFLGDRALVRGLSFMTEVPPAASYAGNEAGCILTDHRWPGPAARRQLRLRIPGHLVSREIDDPGGGSFVYFRSGGPGAGKG